MEELLNKGRNIIICGGLGSGKSTLATEIVSMLPKWKKSVIVNGGAMIEETKEIISGALSMSPEIVILDEVKLDRGLKVLDSLKTTGIQYVVTSYTKDVNSIADSHTLSGLSDYFSVIILADRVDGKASVLSITDYSRD